MADNVNITPGSGATVAADDVSGVLYQRVKLTLGADGVSSGDVAAANPIPAKITDGTNAATIDTRGAKNALAVEILDGSGSQITSFGGGTQYTEDAASAADPVGNQLLARRRDSLSTETTTDGDVTALNSTGKGELYVKHVDALTVNSHAVTNAGTFAVQDSEKVADNAAFTDGTTKVLPAGFIYDEVAGTALTENDAAAARINVNRAQVAAIEDGATRGRYATVTASNAVKVDGSAVTQPVSGTVTSADSQVIADNAGFTDGTSKLFMHGYIYDEVAGTALSENDAAAARVTANRAQICAIEDASTRGRYATVTASNALKVDNSGVTQPVSYAAATTGGYTPGKLISAASTNATSVKGSAGTLGYITATNINASPRYLKLYDKATAPTVGSDAPVHTFLIPGNTAGSGIVIPLPPQGAAFSNGIGFAITTGVADADTGAVAASDIVINYGYK